MPSQKTKGTSTRMPLNLECLEERIAPAGNIIASGSGGNLTITGDAYANEFAIEPWLDAGSLLITPTSGTTINWSADPLVIPGITRGIKMNLGDGDDAVSLHGIEIAKNLQINAGAGTDTLETDGYVRIAGSLTLSDVEHSDLVDLRLARNMTITYTTDGQNTVNMGNAIVGGNVSITTRGQDFFSTYAFDGVEIAGRLTVSNKTGAHGFGMASTLSIHDTQVGSVKVKGGTGDYDFSFIDSETVLKNGGISLSYGVGDVTALIDNSTVLGSVSLKTAGGLAAMAYDTAFSLQNDSTVFGKLTVRTYDSDDVVVLDDIYVVKGIGINTGTGDSTVSIHHSALGLVEGANKTKIYSSSISQTNSGWSFGSDTTTVSITEADIGRLSLSLRSQDANVSFGRVGVYSNLSIKTQGGDDTLAFNDCHVAGNVAIKTAGGNDVISITEVGPERALSIDTGTGNDIVNMDIGGASGPWSTYKGPVKISLGAGDDFLQMGNPILGASAGDYWKTVAVNGGSGNDEIFYLSNHNAFAAVPKIKAFENEH